MLIHKCPKETLADKIKKANPMDLVSRIIQTYNDYRNIGLRHDIACERVEEELEYLFKQSDIWERAWEEGYKDGFNLGESVGKEDGYMDGCKDTKNNLYDSLGTA